MAGKFKISLKAARVNAEMTQRQVAHKVGVDITTVVNWENGRTSIKATQLEKLCDLYGIPASCIVLPPRKARR